MDESLRVLADVQRRRILDELLTPSLQADGGEETIYPLEEFPEEHQIELYHNHLPLLAEAGFIDWNQNTGAVTRGPRFNEISPLLERIENQARPNL
ncbi:ArsR family transcriptional regulator [Halobacteria archaeon AArc-m2/3/4]|uniref:ArsR family transcriptional regulator n=1 Tax=Natronoglomus mannanivorans TaxID=2979990 RepID=A0ABT2QAW7_9EURY|nr:ArsR family transcriptional regulator [Halobacteria archaeon AArc-m2/3/4]